MPWVMVGDDPMPYQSFKCYAPSDFTEPFGIYLFRVGEGDTIPTFQPTPVYEPTDFIEPYPLGLWRVVDINDEKPFHLLMPDMVTYAPTPSPTPSPVPTPVPPPSRDPIHIIVDNVKRGDAGNSYNNGEWVIPWYNFDN